MQKITMLVSLGEGDSPQFQYGSANNINDGRGYTITTIGFTSGTGDFIFVAACYNDAKPGNVLQKYWGTRDSSGRALNGLIYYNDLYNQSGLNQCDTSRIDSLGMCTAVPTLTCFQQDLLTAAADPVFTACVDSMAASFYLAPAAQHVQARGFTGALTLGFLYDTEINFGDTDDPSGTPGVQTIMKRADTDYGAGLPTSFASMQWEESRWLGFFIKERTLAMSKDPTWLQDMDQDATWEAARRSNTAMSNMPESGTNLSMDFDFTSAYKAASTNSGTANATDNVCPGSTPLAPCWGDPPLASPWDTCASVYTVTTDKTASATDPTKWVAKATMGNGNYAACPTNPTP
jgi:chitosanase